MQRIFHLFVVVDLFCPPVFPWSHNLSSPEVICDREEAQVEPQIVKTSDGNFIILWVDERRGVVPGFSWKYRDIYGQKINNSGEIQWQEGGLIAFWSDNRTGNKDIFAQRVDASGNIVWETGGISICDQAGEQKNLQAVSDNPGAAVVVWTDLRTGSEQICAQQINFSGNNYWQSNWVL